MLDSGCSQMAWGHSIASASAHPSGIPSPPPKPFGYLAHIFGYIIDIYSFICTYKLSIYLYILYVTEIIKELNQVAFLKLIVSKYFEYTSFRTISMFQGARAVVPVGEMQPAKTKATQFLC